jgi:3-hydroxyisobutyrate dehydrogenase-like beta-hydroxyacid dehydrogenase
MSTTSAQSAVGFIGLGDQGLPMATAIAVAGYPLHVWACHPGPLYPHLPRRRRPGERLRASVVEVLEISQAEKESRKSAARGTLNF